jgi:hypothetical protein
MDRTDLPLSVPNLALLTSCPQFQGIKGMNPASLCPSLAQGPDTAGAEDLTAKSSASLGLNMLA